MKSLKLTALGAALFAALPAVAAQSAGVIFTTYSTARPGAVSPDPYRVGGKGRNMAES